MGHLVRGRETGEVERGIPSEIRRDPPTHLLDVIHPVVERRNDQVDDFEVLIRPFNGLQGLQYGLKPGFRDLPIEFLAEGLQIDRDAIHELEQFQQGGFPHPAVRVTEGQEAFPLGLLNHAIHQFVEDRGFVDAVGD